MRTSGPTTYDRYDRRPDHRGLRRRLVRVHPAAGPRGGAAGRWLVRHGGVRRRTARPRARRHARGRDAVIVVLLPDSGRGYLTKVFNDEWLGQYGFPAGRRRPARRWARCCAASPGGCPTSCTPTPARRSPKRSRSCRSTASRRCPSCAPSRRSWPPRSRARSPSGALLDALFAGTARLTDPSSEHMSPPLPTIGSTEDATRRSQLLETRRRRARARGRQAGRRRSPARTCWPTSPARSPNAG